METITKASLCDCPGVLDRKRRAGRRKPPEYAIEVRTANSRPTFHDREAIWREHQCRDFGPQLLRCRKSSAVQFGALPFSERERHLQLDLRVAANTAQRDPSYLLAEPNKLCVGTRPR